MLTYTHESKIIFSDSNYSLPLEQKLDSSETSASETKKFLVSCRHKGVHKYSGFLISRNEVLTAVQFLNEFLTNRVLPNFTEYSVVVGIDNNSNTKSKPVAIDEVRCHRKYKKQSRSLSHYIGLIIVGHKTFLGHSKFYNK